MTQKGPQGSKLFVPPGVSKERPAGVKVSLRSPGRLDPSDDSLMKKISHGDDQAFEVLFDRHGGRVLGYAARLLGGDMVRAEDISQLVWIRVVQNSEKYVSSGKFSSWLFTLVRNLCFNESRNRKRRGESELLEDDQNAQSQSWNLSPEDVEKALLKKFEVESMKKVIDELPEGQRQALVSWLTEEESYEVLAKNMELTVPAFKSLLFRAKKALEKRGLV